MDPNRILSQSAATVLRIIDYSGDQADYANRLAMICQQRCLVRAVSSLLLPDQISLLESLAGSSDMLTSQQLSRYIEPSQYNQLLLEEWQAILAVWLEGLKPTLSESQRQALANLT